MNLQTLHAGQISGQVPSQAGTMLPGLPQQNGNPMTSQMQNPNVHRNVSNVDPETVKRRKYMLDKIFSFLMQRRQPQSPEIPSRRLVDILKRLEDALFRTAQTMEEYLDLETLERRLDILINNQQLSHASSSPPIGAMIPTPGSQQTGNSSDAGTSSVDSSSVNISSSNTIVSSTVDSGSVHGSSPGINNSNTNKSMKIEPSDSVGACPDAESTTGAQPLLQKQRW